jgi:hypothetical protein
MARAVLGLDWHNRRADRDSKSPRNLTPGDI